MNKALFSAFALSLMIWGPDLWAQVRSFEDLEEEVLPALGGDEKQRFTPLNLHQDNQWNVKVEETIIDKEPLKGQSYSIIPWKDLEPEEWLDVKSWLLERDGKDKISDWKIRLREDRHQELIGKIMKCYGECRIYHGLDYIKGQYLSRLKEGDEIRTGKDSVAWIYTMDGSLLRVSPESSLSLQEINISSSYVFVLSRLNWGHVSLKARTIEFPYVDGPETDSLALPVMIKEANREAFERMSYQLSGLQVRMANMLEPNSGKLQNDFLKELKVKNNPGVRPSKHIMVCPNATVQSTDVSFDLVSLSGGKAYLKRRSAAGEKLQLGLRGYTNKGLETIDSLDWMEIDPTGRHYAAINEVPGTLQLLELVTSRVQTLELAREIWYEQFTIPILTMNTDEKNLAIKHGYTLWGKDQLERREEFLWEYTRRMETTNLRSLENLLARLEKAGEVVPPRELTDAYHQVALKHYLLGLKTRYTDSKMQVREMNDLQYHVWVYKNGKQ